MGKGGKGAGKGGKGARKGGKGKREGKGRKGGEGRGEKGGKGNYWDALSGDGQWRNPAPGNGEASRSAQSGGEGIMWPAQFRIIFTSMWRALVNILFLPAVPVFFVKVLLSPFS